MLSKRFIPILLLAATTSIFTIDQATAQTLYGSAGSLQTRENAHNADWAYNWSTQPNNNPFDVNIANYEYVPMIWSASTNSNANNYVHDRVDQVLALENNFGVHVDYVLGFNEPELSSQSNMSVAVALQNWEIMTERFSGTDIKLVSPAVSGAGAIRTGDPDRPDGWLTEFMDGVEASNADADPNNDLQVDVIAYHFYSVAFNGTSEANKLIGQIDDLYQRYGRPIWITEFAGTSFSAANPVHSTEERQAFNQAFLTALIPQFDARPYVERVSWWQFGGVGVGPQYNRLSNVSGGVYTPTIIGEEYFRTTLDPGQTYDFGTRDFRPTYVHYLKGSNLTNSGPALIEALRAVDVMEGSTTMSGTGDFGFEFADDAFIRVRNGATLRKQGNNTITAPGTPIFNDGTMLVEGGALQLQDGAELTGNGSLSVQSNGTLAISGGIGGEDVQLNSSSIALNQGVFHVKDGRTQMSAQLALLNSSEIRTDGDLVISGGTTGTGAIQSTGLGTLFLNSAGLHQAGAQVSEGSLIVANTDASPTGPGNVIVSGSGTLGGFGQVAGNLIAAGGAVAPGIAESSSGATSVPTFDEGVVVNALDFDFTGIQDDAPLTQTSTLNDGLQLVSGLDFGPGLQPRNASNASNEFNVSGFTTVNNWSSAAANQDYLTFTVAPVEGLAMQLQDVSFELRRNGVNAARLYRIFTSIDGFNVQDAGLTPLAFVLDADDTNKTTLTRAYTGNEIVTEPIEVRIYGWNSNSSSGNTRFTNVSIDASFFSDPNSIAFDPTGILELGGSYTQLDFATLKIDLGGTQAGEFDQLQVAGNVALDGTLDVSLLDGFTGAAGQTFDIITANSVSGTFDNVVAPAGMSVQVNYSNSVVSLQLGVGLGGDFDADGDVDVDDVDFYAGNIGSAATGALAQLDFTGDGQITDDDLYFHIENFVQTSNGRTGTFPGDLNFDGSVDVLGDAFILIGSLGSAVTSYGAGDINMSGSVDVLADAFVLIGNLGRNNASN